MAFKPPQKPWTQEDEDLTEKELREVEEHFRRNPDDELRLDFDVPEHIVEEVAHRIREQGWGAQRDRSGDTMGSICLVIRRVRKGRPIPA